MIADIRRSAHGLVVAAALLASTPLAAQDLGGALDLGQLGATIGVSNAMRGQVAKRGRTAPPPAPARAATLTFRADPARQKATVARWLARIGRSDPASAQQIGAVFAKQSLTQISGPWLGRYGMSTSNGADAAAAYLSTAWLIARGDGGDPTRAQITGLRDQLARALAATPGWASAGDAGRQAFADSLLLQAAVNGALLQGAGADKAKVQAVGAAVARGAQSVFGFDVRRYDLTASGLVPQG